MFFKMFNTQRNVFLFFKQLKIELSQHLWIIQAYKHSNSFGFGSDSDHYFIWRSPTERYNSV